MTTSPVEHWSFHVDSPFRGPAEIRELADRLQPDVAGEARVDSVFGEDLAQTEDEFEAYDAYEPSSEAEAYDEADLTGADLLDQAPASSHPLASVFSLPRLAFDAMAKGGWATAIAVAVGAGLRDVNQLTNMVFWFRHPALIGQKLRPDQRDLAREWLRIRDEIVRPALASAAAPTSPPAPSPGTTAGRRTSIPADGLRWFGPPGEETHELMAFMRKVYALHVQRSKGDFVDTLPESALDDVVPGKKARKDAAAKAREMLAAADAALTAEGLKGSVRIGVLSAYRSADHQFDIWQGKTTKGSGGFPFYYAATKAARRSTRFGGEHSDKAAAYLAAHMGQYVAAPGYSNHQDGLALDLGTRKGTGGLVKLYKGSWFHNWLQKNAHTYHFAPLESEAWHWAYRPPAGASEAGSAFESWSREEVTSTGVPAGRLEVARVPLLSGHRGRSPDLVLRWNDMPSVPTEIDVVVHLHGYSWATMTLPKHIEVWAGLDLKPVDGASGTGRTRPTLTVLPRGHFTGVQVGKIYRYTFPALTSKDGFSTLLRVALERFAERTGGSPPKVGRLILTAHSGGGAPLLHLLHRHDPHEVHVFDGLDQDATPLAEWARRHIQADQRAVQSGAAPTSAMRVFSGPSTQRYSLRLDRDLAADLQEASASIRDRYRVETSRLGHWQIARQYGWRMLTDPSADVPDATRPRPPGRTPNRLFELDSAEIPFLPEAVEAQDLDEDAGEFGESDTEGEDEPEFEELEFDGPASEDMEQPELEDPEAVGPYKEAETYFAPGLAEPTQQGEDPLALAGGDLARWAAPEAADEEAEEAFWPGDLLRAMLRKPTVGFEFDVHYGPIPALPARNGDVLGTQVQVTDGFEVKLDTTRLEINLRPFETTDAGEAELTATADRVAAFAKGLQDGCRTATPVNLPGFTGARPFTHPEVTVPIGKLPIGGRFTNCSVWAAPQTTLTIPLAKVAALVEQIKASEGDGPGVALSGGPGDRMGVRSEALYRALREVKRARRAATFSDALEGFLILFASYLWTSELPYRFPAEGALVDGKVHDYEPFGKAFLPINVKTPFPQVFGTLLDDADKKVFRDRFAVGAARVNLFRLARPAGATLADGSRAFLPPGRIELGLNSVHERQKAAFPSAAGSPVGVVPTWNDLVEHTLDATHRDWGDRLWVPLSKQVDVSKTRPRVLLELRRIGFAAVERARWKPFILRMHALTKSLNG
jgi:hypothetical protein